MTHTALQHERHTFLRIPRRSPLALPANLSRCLQPARNALLRLRDGAAGLIAPAVCRVCSLPLLQAHPYPVCGSCIERLQPTAFAVCWKCGDAIGMDDEHASGLVHHESLRCAQCMTREPHFHRACAFGPYLGTLRQLIHLHKFEAMQPLAVPLGQKLANAIAQAVGGSNSPYTVVAVPLFRGKRGFNQSVLLADAALHELRRSHPEFRLEAQHTLLRRVRPTQSQSHLTPDQRKKNVRGAFVANADAGGRHILLIDDVYTTGATADECTAILLRARAASVTVVTLARAHMRDAVPAIETFSTEILSWKTGAARHEAAPGPIRKHAAEMGERK